MFPGWTLWKHRFPRVVLVIIRKHWCIMFVSTNLINRRCPITIFVIPTKSSVLIVILKTCRRQWFWRPVENKGSSGCVGLLPRVAFVQSWTCVAVYTCNIYIYLYIYIYMHSYMYVYTYVHMYHIFVNYIYVYLHIK